MVRLRWAALGWAGLALTTTLLLLCAQACEPERGTPRGLAAPGGDGSGGTLFTETDDGPCVVGSECGDELHEIAFDVPNVYFVLDRSGSMGSSAGPGLDSRYEVVREGASDMLRKLGALINVGAAVFPYGDLDENTCQPGDEVMSVRPGDPVDPNSTAAGPTTAAFGAATDLEPAGLTPLAATLVSLQPRLSVLEGRTIVMLFTDGVPNCNPDGDCGKSPVLCVDEPAAVSAIEALSALGIETYVIGIPFGDAEAAVLDAMAEAAGTAQTDGPSAYHRVDDLASISNVFEEIAAAAISCDVALLDPPAEQGFTNVYFDCKRVPFDEGDGWGWLTGDSVRLHGAACQRLKSGQVAQIHVVSGCPTEPPS